MVTNMSTILYFVLICGLINSYSQTITGSYFVPEYVSSFDDIQINCIGTGVCQIDCNIRNSCKGTIINCNGAATCNIDCGFSSCDDISIYTDYTNYPLSNAILTCAEHACDQWSLKDSKTSSDIYESGIIQQERFRIFCNFLLCKYNGIYGHLQYEKYWPLVPSSVKNQTGEYYFNTGSLIKINCTTDKLCYINCNSGSCHYSNIHCNNAANCIIICGDNSCNRINIYIDQMSNSSSTTMTCLGSESGLSCYAISILNSTSEEIYASGNFDYHRFNIFCYGLVTCSYDNPWTTDWKYPTVPATEINENGEYYFNPGSINYIQCENEKLCYIECGDGSCAYSFITCKNTEACVIHCSEGGHCDDMTVTVMNVSKFEFQCDNAEACTKSSYDITDVNSVEIRCHRENSCDYSDYSIDQVDTLYVYCDESRSCDWMVWDLNNINNGTFICQNGACYRQNFQIDNADYIQFNCDKVNEYIYPSSCKWLDIEANNTKQLDIFCNDGGPGSCSYPYICTDNILNIACLGEHSCSSMDICNGTIINEITNPPTTSFPSTMPTTTTTTEYPTTAMPTVTVTESDSESVATRTDHFANWILVFIIILAIAV